MHFEQSRDWLQAVVFLTRAAENATRRSAHHEAVDLARRGLEVLRILPDNAERAPLEIKLRMILGASLMVIKGFASEEVENVFAAGRALFWSHGPSPELFHMLWSLGLYYQFGRDVPASLQISEKLLELAKGLNDGALVMEAQRSVGAALVILGRCREAIVHLDASAALYSDHGNHRHSLFIGRDCKVMTDSFAAIALWALGDNDAASERMDAAINHARDLRHPETLIVAGHFASNIHYLKGEPSLMYECAKSAMELAEEYGLELWRAYGIIELGWAEAELGDPKNGIDHMQRGLAAYEATGAQLWLPHFVGMLADQLAKADRIPEAIEVVARGIACSEKTGERYSLAELHRLHGEFILKSGDHASPGDSQKLRGTQKVSLLSKAQSCFATSLEIAKKQHAKAWELRTKNSLQRLSQM